MAQSELQGVLDMFRTMFSSAYTDLESCTDYMSKDVSEILDTLSTESMDEDTRLLKANILAELGYPKLLVKMWQAIPQRNSLQRMQRLRVTRAFWNYTDLSEKFCRELGKAGALEIIIQDLENIRSAKTAQTQDQINSDLTILYNCARLCEENQQICRRFRSTQNKTLVEILTSYLDVESQINMTLSLVTLAFIVEEDESEKLLTSGVCVTFLVSLLEESVKYASHRAQSVLFTTEELLAGLNELAVCDANKRKIVEAGAIPHLTKILKDGYNIKEQEMAARVFWRLAFIAETRDVIVKTEEAMNALKEFRSDCHAAVVRDACTGALWELQEGHIEDVAGSASAADDEALCNPHVMISYQWDSQEQMMAMKEKLISQGYNVWMDVDKMEGNILATMAEAVEKAEVVLVGLSKKYKESTNCRTEASYAYKLKKPIVPLLVEPDYEPDGWLGALAGMLLYYRAYSEEAISTDFNSLCKELGNKGKKDTNAKPKQPQVAASKTTKSSTGSLTPSHGAPLKPTPISPKESVIASWTKEQVQSWLDDKDLAAIKTKIESYCDGKHLLQMYRQFQRSPTFFETGLKDDLKLDFHDIIKFLTALEELI